MDEIIPFDWHRMLLGDAPPLFLLEILFRVTVMWLWAAVLLRWIGGRSISQMSIVEFLLVIALGSAVGDPMFAPDVPLTHGMLVILLVVLLDKGLDAAIRRWPKAKTFVDGRPVEVLRDGRILCDGLMARGLGTLEVMEMLRLQGVENLGNLRRAYLEPSGELSLFRFDSPRPGLAIVPPVELTDPPPPGPDDQPCCLNCGDLPAVAGDVCDCCGEDRWTRATLG